ncbi:MAG: ABC transporter permease [Spirochaetia bacterium]
MTALIIAVFLMIMGVGWVQGYSTYLYQALIDFETGNIQVLPESYYGKAARFPLDLTLSPYRELKEKTESLPGVEAAAGRIVTSLQMIIRGSSIRLVGRGIDPAAEKQVTVLDEYIAEGEYLDDQGGVLLGKPLAEKIGVTVGDFITMKAVDRDGGQNVTEARIKGLFDFGYPALDEEVLYADIATMSSLLSMKDGITKLIVALKPGYDEETVIPEISAAFDELGIAADARIWKDFAQTTVSAVQGDSAAFWMMLIILYVLIIIGILNSMSMTIQERTGEIATMRAIGMKKKEVFGLFLAEGLSIALLSSVFAVLLSIPAAYFLGSVGIDITRYMPDDLPIPFGERFYADFRIWQYLASAGVAVITGVLGSLIPSFRAMKINTAQALEGKRF